MQNITRKVVISLVFAVVVYGCLTIWSDVTTLRQALTNFMIWLIGPILGLSLLNYGIRFIKWQYYLQIMKISLPWWQSLLIYLSGFALTITPGKIGELIKIGYIKKITGTPMTTTSALVLVDRLTDVIALVFLITGNQHFILDTLYRFSLIGSFLLAIIFGSRSFWGRLLSFMISSIFVYAILAIHPINPQLYDIVYPFCVLIYIVTLHFLRTARSSWLLGGLSMVGGLATAMMELSRPFALLLLPIMLGGAYWWLRSRPKRYFLLFCLSLLILSGSWHTKLLLFNDGQILWSNHSGYNLQRAWHQSNIPAMPSVTLLDESLTEIAPGRWSSYNSNEHNINSNLIKNNILKYIITHPRDNIVYIDQRFFAFIAPVTSIYGNTPQNIPPFYAAAVHLSIFLLASSLVTIIYHCYKRRSLSVILEPTSLWIVLTTATIFLLVIGESGEEARLIITVLPLLAGLPIVQPTTTTISKKNLSPTIR